MLRAKGFGEEFVNDIIRLFTRRVPYGLLRIEKGAGMLAAFDAADLLRSCCAVWVETKYIQNRWHQIHRTSGDGGTSAFRSCRPMINNFGMKRRRERVWGPGWALLNPGSTEFLTRSSLF